MTGTDTTMNPSFLPGDPHAGASAPADVPLQDAAAQPRPLAPGPLVAGDAHARALSIEVPFLRDLGVVVTEFGDGRAVLALDVLPRHTNSLGATHGGVAMTLLDVAMAMAARSFEDNGARAIVTIEMATSFMRPSSGRVYAHGVCVHRTASLAFCEAEVRDAQGRVCAKSKGTFKFWRKAASAE